VSTRNPLEDTVEVGRRAIRQTDVDLRTKRGYLSKTMNTYQFGILEKGQWAGEERLLKQEEEPFDYSIIARTPIRAFAIEKQEAQKKFSKEFMTFIAHEVHQRFQWILGRARKLAETSAAIARLDPLAGKYDENLAITSKKYPTASKMALTNIRKQKLLASSVPRLPPLVDYTPSLAFGTALPPVVLSPNSQADISALPESTRHERLDRTDRTDRTQQDRLDLRAYPLTSRSPARAHVLVTSVPHEEGRGHVRGLSTERLLAIRGKIPIEIATSASVYACPTSIVPYFSKPLYNSRLTTLGLASTKARTSSVLRSLEGPPAAYKFAIGNRPIRVVQAADKRVNTPNPFDNMPRARPIAQT
jgi:hypothetical protein